MPRSKRLPSRAERLIDEADFGRSSLADLSETAEQYLPRMERALLVPREQLHPMPLQPRQSLREDDALYELARSIAADGLLQPLVAAPDREHPGHFLLIAGHRRLAAAELLARQEVELALPDEGLNDETERRRQAEARQAARERVASLPVVLRDVDPETAFALALVENLQRDDLTRREVMDAVKRLRDHYGWSVREIGRRTGRSHTDLSRLLRIADDAELAPLVAEDVLTPTAAGMLVERDVVPLRAPILAAIRAGHITTVAQIVAAISQARERESALARSRGHGEARRDVVGSEPAQGVPEALEGATGAPVAHMSHWSATTEDATDDVEVPTATAPEPTLMTPQDDAGERTVPVTAHTRRIGSRPAFDAERAERLARDMVQLAHENIPPDAASHLKLEEAIRELGAYLTRHRSRPR